MSYDLPPMGAPSLILRLEARYADAIHKAAAMVERYIDVQNNHRPPFAIMCYGDRHLFGSIDIDRPIISEPINLEDQQHSSNNEGLRLILAEFRKALAGPIRLMMSSVSSAFDGQAVYFVFYNNGAVAIVPQSEQKDRWRLARLQLRGARTIEVERICATVNTKSTIAYHAIREMIAARTKAELDEDPTLQRDALDEPVEAPRPITPWTPPTSPLADEEDALEDDEVGGEGGITEGYHEPAEAGPQDGGIEEMPNGARVDEDDADTYTF